MLENSSYLLERDPREPLDELMHRDIVLEVLKECGDEAPNAEQSTPCQPESVTIPLRQR